MNRIAEILAQSLGDSELVSLTKLASGRFQLAQGDGAIRSLIALRLAELGQGGDSIEVTRLGYDVLALRKRAMARASAA